jgi:hypothetical protein
LNGRFNNLVYGSYAPGAPDVFIDDAQFKQLWDEAGRTYLVCDRAKLPQLDGLVGSGELIHILDSGGKVLLTNRPLAPPR